MDNTMSNDITIKLTLSDQLLAKLAYLLQPPKHDPTLAAMAQLLGAPPEPPKAPSAPKERAKVGFKIK
jgi:hypothetical protein